MTRELSHKAAAALLRQTFAAKGTPITHTESLDLLAKLKGYEAWSHMQQAGSAAPASELHTAVKRRNGRVSIPESFMQHYGPDKECPAYPRATWRAQEPGTPYWDWVADCLRSNGTWTNVSYFVTPEPVKVTLSNGWAGDWKIEQNLSDRWGDINDAEWGGKSGLPVLLADEELLGRLQSQMCEESTFIVRKDGQFGLLFEFEYLCAESESNNDDDDDNYHSREHVVAVLLKAMVELEKQYPQVQFCVPDPVHIIYERPAIWGFFKPDTLSEEQRESLNTSLYLAA